MTELHMPRILCAIPITSEQQFTRQWSVEDPRDGCLVTGPMSLIDAVQACIDMVVEDDISRLVVFRTGETHPSGEVETTNGLKEMAEDVAAVVEHFEIQGRF